MQIEYIYPSRDGRSTLRAVVDDAKNIPLRGDTITIHVSKEEGSKRNFFIREIIHELVTMPGHHINNSKRKTYITVKLAPWTTNSARWNVPINATEVRDC